MDEREGRRLISSFKLSSVSVFLLLISCEERDKMTGIRVNYSGESQLERNSARGRSDLKSFPLSKIFHNNVQTDK